LKRLGAKHKPFYRVVVADSTVPTQGENLASLGRFDPLAKEKPLRIDTAQLAVWKSRGAVVSPSVARLMKRAAAAPKTE
jgi:small subunit ribosomal protein S16